MEIAPRRASRRGSAILIAAAMVGALTVFAIFQQFLARQSMVVVQRAHLSGLALLQGESALEELVDQVAAKANAPETELYAALRNLMREPWVQLDVAPFLERPAIAIHPEIGFLEGAEGDPTTMTAEVEEFQARLRGPRYPEADRGTEEFTAILTLSVIVHAANPRGELRRRVSATYEVRGLMTTPPRPFDQAGLFVQNPEALIDLGAIDQERDRLVQDYVAFRQRLEAAAPGAGAARERLEQLAGGMVEPEALEGAYPEYGSHAGGVVLGPRHSSVLVARSLDLGRALARRRERRQELRAAFEAALGNPDEAGPAAYAVVSALRAATAEFDRFHVQFGLVAPSSEDFQSLLRPYFDRLEADFYRQRVHLRLAADGPLMTRWAAGEASLNGVVALVPGGEEVHVQGQPRGQLVLVAEGQHVVLEGGAPEESPEDAPGPEGTPDRLLVVSVGGDVTVTGDVRASIFMVPGDGAGGGKLRIRAGATVTGVVAVGDARPGQVALEGAIAYDGSLRTRSPVAEEIAPAPEGTPPGVDPYTIVLSPMPIF